MSYDAWRRFAQIKAVELDERERLRQDREFARITERARAATADPTAVTKAAQSYGQATVTREWVQREILAASDTLADAIGAESGAITREERRLMREYVAGELARERRKWRQEMSVEVSTVIGKMLGVEREKWRRDIYDAVEWANKAGPVKGEVVPMVRRVTRDDAA
jgi:hypothetical protein